MSEDDERRPRRSSAEKKENVEKEKIYNKYRTVMKGKDQEMEEILNQRTVRGGGGGGIVAAIVAVMYDVTCDAGE